MNRIKERKRRKAALSDRKSAAAQARMKSIANLAADDRVPKKKRKTGGGAYGISVDFKFNYRVYLQRIRSGRMMQIGQSIAKLCAACYLVHGCGSWLITL